MNVILCHADDGEALLLARSWHDHGTPVELVTVEELAYSPRVVWRQGVAGDCGSTALQDGRSVRPENVGLLINRIRWLPTEHFTRAAPVERGYAESELSAFLLAWLNGIGGRVLNPPHPYALGGPMPSVQSLHHHAAVAGLPVEARRWDASTAVETGPAVVQRAVVFDGRVYGAGVPRTLHAPLARLAILLGLPLMQAEFAGSSPRAWRFVGARAHVDFSVGGQALARALLAAAREVAA